MTIINGSRYSTKSYIVSRHKSRRSRLSISIFRCQLYATIDVCDQKRDGPTNAWVVRCSSWKTMSVPWFGRDYWHGGRADNSNKTATNAKYSNCKGLNHETYDVSLQNLRSPPFWIMSPLRISFLSILRLFTSYVHDSISALGTLWFRF